MHRISCLAFAAIATAVAIPSFAAEPAKSTTAAKKTTATPPAEPWVDMPRGSPHMLRSKVQIRGAKAEFWKMHAPAKLDDLKESAAECSWTGHTPPNLQDARLFIEDDHTGKWLYLMFADGTYVRRSWTFGSGSSGESNFIASEPGDDWNYYVMFEETTGPAANRIYKKYRVEIFPPVGKAPDCDTNDRPPNKIKVASRADLNKPHACESGSGTGTEPKH